MLSSVHCCTSVGFSWCFVAPVCSSSNPHPLLICGHPDMTNLIMFTHHCSFKIMINFSVWYAIALEKTNNTQTKDKKQNKTKKTHFLQSRIILLHLHTYLGNFYPKNTQCTAGINLNYFSRSHWKSQLYTASTIMKIVCVILLLLAHHVVILLTQRCYFYMRTASDFGFSGQNLLIIIIIRGKRMKGTRVFHEIHLWSFYLVSHVYLVQVQHVLLPQPTKHPPFVSDALLTSSYSAVQTMNVGIIIIHIYI